MSAAPYFECLSKAVPVEMTVSQRTSAVQPNIKFINHTLTDKSYVMLTNESVA